MSFDRSPELERVQRLARAVVVASPGLVTALEHDLAEAAADPAATRAACLRWAGTAVLQQQPLRDEEKVALAQLLHTDIGERSENPGAAIGNVSGDS